MAGEKVLVVDDYEDSRELYAEYLRLCGYEVFTAADGEAALRCASERTCDLIVLDLALPKFNGISVLKRLREDASVRTPVIILSASVAETVRREALDAGADRFLTKPCAPDDLESSIRELLTATHSP